MPIAYNPRINSKSVSNDNHAAEFVDELLRDHKTWITTSCGNASSQKCGTHFYDMLFSVLPWMVSIGTTRIMTGIGIRLRAVRYAVGARNLSELCRELGMNKSSKWQHWEKGRNLPNDLILLEFRRRYPGFSLDYIYDGDKFGIAHGLVQKLDAAMAEAQAEIMELLAKDAAKAKKKAAKAA